LSAQVTTELDVFARLRRAHSSLTRTLETRLLADHGLTISDYEALLHLSRAGEGRLRRVDLAELLLLTPSGVTRLLDGLQAHGLVDKATCTTDARVTYAVITNAGRQRLETAASAQADVLRDVLGATLGSEELETLATLLARLPGGAVGGEACLPPPE
jgi:DNA-binding MarR family transcriptional regulator